MKNESKNGWNRRNLGQNSRWNINLLLKINFSRWIKKLGAIGPLDRHITIGITSRPSDQHGRNLSCQITLHEGREISPKNQRFVSDISPIFCHHRRFFQKIVNISPRVDISPIFWRFLRKYLPFDFFPRNIVSTPPNTRYIPTFSSSLVRSYNRIQFIPWYSVFLINW